MALICQVLYIAFEKQIILLGTSVSLMMALITIVLCLDCLTRYVFFDISFAPVRLSL